MGCETGRCSKTSTPYFQKEWPSWQIDYRPISILTIDLLVFYLYPWGLRKIIYNQPYEFVEKILNSIICSSRKAHSTQHTLFKLIQSWQKEIDNHGFVGTILMDLSKAYDCISHELLITKLHSYGVTKNKLKLILKYLSRRKQKTKIVSSVSTWYDIITGVPQESILGPLLYNIFMIYWNPVLPRVL